MITKASELQQLLDGKMDPAEEFVLAPAAYHIHGTDAWGELHLKSVSRYNTSIHVHETPLLVGDNSEIRNLTFHCAPDCEAVLRLDRSSRAEVRKNFFNAPTAWDGRGKVAEFERQRYGIITTDQSISEANWNCIIKGNEFRWFKAGVDQRMPGTSPVGEHGVKGTGKWMIENNGFDGCEIGIHGVRPIMNQISSNHFQLHRVGILIEGGHTNWLLWNDFERGYGKFDIEYDDQTCQMLAMGNTASVKRISPNVRNTKHKNVYARDLRKLPIWTPCENAGGK